MDISRQIEKHLTARGNMRKRDIMLGNFLGGITWGVGSVIGATIVIAILLGILRSINWVPFAKETADTIEHRTSVLTK